MKPSKKRFYDPVPRTVTTAKKLYRKFGTRYLFMLGNYLTTGMNIKVAIWECYNKLEC